MKSTRLPGLLLLTGLGLIALAVGLLQPAAAQGGPDPTPLPLYALPDARQSRVTSSNTIALAKDNRTLVAANMMNNTLSIVLPAQGEVAAEIAVGSDPRTVALTDDSLRAVVANRGDGTLSVVDLQAQQVVNTIRLGGVLPYAVVVGENNLAYVSLQASDSIAVVDLTAGQVRGYVAVPDAPTGLTLWGDFLYVTHFWNGQVSLIYLPQGRVISSMSTGLDTGLFQAIELDISRGLAYLPQTRSNAQNANLTYDTTVFPLVNVLDLRGLNVRRESRITLDTADRPVNMPFAAALDRFQQRLYVANAGSNNVSVIDLNTGQARRNIDVGANPRGILLNRDSSRLFVHNALEGTLSIIETRTLEVVDELPISDFNLPVDTLLAAQLFYSAADPRLSADGWISCANCHFDGMADGRAWQGFPDGTRNTPVLYGLLETGPYNWSGTWDELADAELKIRGLQAGMGLIDGEIVSPALGNPHGGLSLDLDVLATYLATLPGPANPTSADAALVERGAQVFMAQGCGQCHVGVVATDAQRHDVGTDGEFDTPSLRWLWASAPYLHDGSARNLAQVFILPGAHQLIQTVAMDDLEALVAYLLTL